MHPAFALQIHPDPFATYADVLYVYLSLPLHLELMSTRLSVKDTFMVFALKSSCPTLEYYIRANKVPPLLALLRIVASNSICLAHTECTRTEKI